MTKEQRTEAKKVMKTIRVFGLFLLALIVVQDWK